MYLCVTCVYAHTCRCQQKPEEAVRSPRAGVLGRCEQPGMCLGWDLNLGPLERQQKLNCQATTAPCWLNLNCKVPLPYKVTLTGWWKPYCCSIYNTSRSLGFPSGRTTSVQVGLSTTLLPHLWLFVELGDISQKNKEGNHTFPTLPLSIFIPIYGIN